MTRLLAVAFALLIAACGGLVREARDGATAAPLSPALRLQESGPTHFDDWMHAPMRAGDHEAVTFSVAATSDEGIARAELYVYEYELYRGRDGLQHQRARADGRWGLLREWDFAAAPRRTLKLAHAYAQGFRPHSRVEYVWRLTDAGGAVTDRFARFDAGTSPWPEDKVLLYSASRRPMRELIDLSFFRDVDYADSVARFHADVEAMIRGGFLAPQAYGNRRTRWAFYTTDRTADGAAIAADITNDELLPDFLKDFSVPGIDAFCLVHREDYTDRSLLLENFHALSNNLFSAEAHNWGTAIHECGHAIFHLSDEYGGCACFQTHASSNVFRERADCAAWNVANGFPAEDCYPLADLYGRTWFSAEQPTFFEDVTVCQAHNERLGLSADSCRTFVAADGRQLYWSFESTCIMHDDGDDVVRPFQRACRKVIDEAYERLRRPVGVDVAFAKTRYDNIYGYEPVVHVEMQRQDELWSVRIGEARMGVPTEEIGAGGEIVMRVLDEAGDLIHDYRLSAPGAVHAHADEDAHADDAFEVPTTGTLHVAVPASHPIAAITCEYDRDAQRRSARETVEPYREGFYFDVAAEVATARTRAEW